jgi:hypothetical protein
MPPPVREGHRRLLSDALALPTFVKPQTPIRRRVMMVAMALVVGTAIPAVAAQQALPGEALYGWKKGSESFLVLFDRDIRARHRLSELESLLSRGGDVGQVLTAAEVELAEVEDEALLARWSNLLADLEEPAGGGEDQDHGGAGGLGVAPAEEDETDDGEEAAEEEDEATDEEVETDDRDEEESESDDDEEDDHSEEEEEEEEEGS